ncbi:MAG: hypothetical protein V3U54_13410 [Thermodesulfobacteriota bacterium]
MGLIVANVENQKSAGSTLTSITDDIKFTFIAHALHLNVFELATGGTVSTLQVLVDKLTSINLLTTVAQPESTIDTDDWFDLLPWIGINRYISILTAADNIPHAFGLLYPLSPFPNDPTQNFGAPANRLTQFQTNWAADAALGFDNAVYDLTVEGMDVTDKPNPQGYVKFTQDSFTSGAVDSVQKTDIIGRRLLGTFNFQTVAFDDLAAAAANNVTTIREQSVTFSENVKIGPYKPSRSWTQSPFHREVLSGTAGVGTQLDLGHFLSDYGWMNNNTARLGIDITPGNVKVETKAGVASSATRVYPVALVR